MEQLSNEEKAKVFAMYYGCECRVTNGNPNQVLFIKEIYPDACTVSTKGSKGGYFNSYNSVKLLLIPLANITDEDKRALSDIVTGDTTAFNDEKDYIACLLISNLVYGQMNKRAMIANIFAYQYLISKGYAVPLFFAPGHWANGKTAIELSISIEK